MEIFEVFPIVSFRGMSTGIPIFCGPKSIKKSEKLLRARFSPLLGGDLNPVSGFRFPLFSTVLPWKSTNRVENTGRQWKQNCCKLLQVYVPFLWWLYPLKP
jgi:hypothetical protein